MEQMSLKLKILVTKNLINNDTSLYAINIV